MLYDNYSKEHALKCMIGQAKGWIRIYTSKGDEESAQIWRNKLIQAQNELIELTRDH